MPPLERALGVRMTVVTLTPSSFKMFYSHADLWKAELVVCSGAGHNSKRVVCLLFLDPPEATHRTVNKLRQNMLFPKQTKTLHRTGAFKLWHALACLGTPQQGTPCHGHNFSWYISLVRISCVVLQLIKSINYENCRLSGVGVQQNHLGDQKQS